MAKKLISLFRFYTLTLHQGERRSQGENGIQDQETILIADIQAVCVDCNPIDPGCLVLPEQAQAGRLARIEHQEAALARQE